MKALTWILLVLSLTVVHVMVWLSTLPDRAGDPWITLGLLWWWLLTSAAFIVSQRAYKWLP